MQTATVFLIALIFFASLIMLFLGIQAWLRRKTTRDPLLAVLLFCISWWGIAYTVEFLSLDFAGQYFWARMKYFSIVLIPLAFYGFARQYRYTGAPFRLNKIWPFLIIPVLTLVGVWTDPLHHLFYRSAVLDVTSHLETTRGPLFWLHTVYSYALLVAAAWLMVRAFRQSSSVYRRQLTAMLAAVSVPWLANILHITGTSPLPDVDLTTAAFLISGFLIYIAVFHFGLLGISPVARAEMVDHMSDGMLVLDSDDRILDMNPALVGWLQQDLSAMLGRPLAEVFPQPAAEQISGSALPGGQIETMVGLDGSARFYEVTASQINDRRDKPTARLLLIRDITERKHIELAEREQRKLAEVFRDIASVLNSTVEMETVLNLVLSSIARVVPHDSAHVLLLDEDGQILGRRLMGYSPEEEQEITRIALWAAGQKSRRDKILSMGAVVIEDARESQRFGKLALFHRLPAILDVPIRFQDRLIGMLTLASSKRGAYTQKHAALLQAFADQAALAIENARLYGEVEHLTRIDELTRFYNYRGLLELGQREFDRAQRFDRPLSVLFFDIDHFRSFNNLYTHAVGNLVLQKTADVVLNCLRAVDLAARFGGEEFVVLLPETNLATAVNVAERIRKGIADTTVDTDYGSLNITISVGVAELTKDTVSFDALIDRANHAEHHAKEEGRNRVVTYPRDILKGRILPGSQDGWSI